MLYPRIFNDSIFDDLMDMTFPTFRDLEDVDKKLYGKNAPHVMKTDVHDLTITAAKGLDTDRNDKQGKLIRRERYAGSMQRSFYVGKNLDETDIKAKFEDGVLKLTVPKKEAKLPEKKVIMIED